MEFKISGRAAGEIPPIRMGKGVMLLPEGKDGKVYAKEIVFPCTVHDIAGNGDSFTIHVSVEEELEGELREAGVIDLQFAVFSRTPFVLTLSDVCVYRENSDRKYDLTKYVSFVRNAGWERGQREITFPSFQKLKQILLERGELVGEDLRNVVERSEAVSLDEIVAACEREQEKMEEYEKE